MSGYCCLSHNQLEVASDNSGECILLAHSYNSNTFFPTQTKLLAKAEVLNI